MPLPKTNVVLLERLRNPDDAEAWRECYETYSRAIFCFVRGRGLGVHQSEDVLQETMVVLMKEMPSFIYDPKKGKFRNFVFKIARNKTLEVKRRNRRAAEVPLEHCENLPEDTEPSRAERLRWSRYLVDEVLRRLEEKGLEKPRNLAVFRALMLDGLKAAEVSERFQVTTNYIYVIKHRVRRLVKQESRPMLQLPERKDPRWPNE